MSKPRIIARLDIKGPNLIKSINLEGIRVIGDPQAFAERYYNAGADELIYIDMVASLYGRNNLLDIVRQCAQNIFIPLTVGGGIRSVEDARLLFQNGADKVAINTAALARPELISEIAELFGSQAMVLSIEAKKMADGHWEAYGDCGRERTHIDVVDWAIKAYHLGAGEILLTSIDQEGTRKGYDIELIQRVSTAVPIPVIASGGLGQPHHAVQAVQAGADAIAVASVLHYDLFNLSAIRTELSSAGIPVRKIHD
jgi:cyclase